MAQVTLSRLDRLRLPARCPVCGKTTTPYTALSGVFCPRCYWQQVVAYHSEKADDRSRRFSVWHK